MEKFGSGIKKNPGSATLVEQKEKKVLSICVKNDDGEGG
jgi:hypothetical protein